MLWLIGYLLSCIAFAYWFRQRGFSPSEAIRWCPVWPLLMAYALIVMHEMTYGYADSSPATLVDPRGTAPGKCAVYRCTLIGNKLRHKFICVEGPHGGCSMGNYWDGPGDTGYGNNCRQPGITDCELLSTDCVFANEVCTCTREYARGKPGLGGYLLYGTCWGFPGAMACCACRAFKGEERRTCLLSQGCISPAGSNSIYDDVPEVGPYDQCPPGYKKKCGNNWRIG
jgi:hypothetical protein